MRTSWGSLLVMPAIRHPTIHWQNGSIRRSSDWAANHVIGGTIKIRYLFRRIGIAMIGTDLGGLPEYQYHKGPWIGAFVFLVMAPIALRMVFARMT